MKPPLLVKGMHGLGDNLHQRAIVRQLLPHYELWLESSWVAPYVDLVGQGLKVVRKATPLRTQSKNAEREAKQFVVSPPAQTPHRVIWYRPAEVRSRGGVLAAMCANAGVSYLSADFRLPVPNVWLKRADDLIASWPTRGRPIMVYRPLVERTEWDGCAARNPAAGDYVRIFNSIRDKFFVVSLADLVDGVEWMASPPIGANVTLHKGELDFEIMAALFARAALVFCSPGFAVILAQAVETPVICTFGRYERAYSFSAGARYSPYLGIEPIKPCDDFKHDHGVDKSIDLAIAIPGASVFASQAIERHAAGAAKV